MPSIENPNLHVHSAGVQLGYATAKAGPYTYINELTDADTNAMTCGRIPGSTLVSPNKVMRKMPGWIDPGEMAFKVALTGAQLGALFTMFFNRTRSYWEEYYPPAFDASVVGANSFFGWIGNMQPGQGMTRDQNELIIVNLTVVLESIDSGFYAVTTVPS